MSELVLLFGLSVVALVLFTVERSLSLFSWSRLEALGVPRARRQAVEKCLEERELASACFLVIGGACVAAASVLLAQPAAEAWSAVGRAALLAVALIWILPELISWKTGDQTVLYLVPLLYRVAGAPFRGLRAILPQPALSNSRNGHAPEGEAIPEPSVPDAQALEFFKMAVRLQHTQVREIMIPRIDMVSVTDTATLRQAAQASLRSGYSRLPVHRGNRDQIVGILHIRELLKVAGTEKWDTPCLEEIMRPPFFIPETKTISELMEEFRGSSIHMGIVLDEYGGTSGLVTLEDLLEELIGEIHDEHEAAHREAPLFKWLGAKGVAVRAVMRIEEFNEEFEFDLPEQEDFDTLGGFVTFSLGKIPLKDESFEFRGVRFTVTEADLRHVVQVRVDFQKAPRPGEKA